MALKFRPGESTDIPYIISTWLASARKGERHVHMTNQDYFLFYRHRIIQLLSSSYVLIAYDDAVDADTIAGFLVYDFTKDNKHLIVHYINVRKALWNQKTGKQMLASVYPEMGNQPIICTSLFIFHEKLKDKYQLVYNPYVMVNQ